MASEPKSTKQRVVQNNTTTVTNQDGELLSVENERQVVQHRREPQYIKLYLNDISRIMGMSQTLQGVMMLLLEKLDYEGFIDINTAYRRSMAEKLNVKRQTIDNALGSLKKKGLILSEETNRFRANPYLFAKGEWKDIVEQRDAFELKIRYNSDGSRQLETERVREEQKVLDFTASK